MVVLLRENFENEANEGLSGPRFRKGLKVACSRSYNQNCFQEYF